MADMTIRTRRIEAITFRRNSRLDRIRSTARCHTTIKKQTATGPKRRGSFRGSGKRIRARACPPAKGRWVAIHKGNRVVYAQWEDAGPFRTDHWQYVFGNERPKPNLNKGAGLDVSPAVRDYLGLQDTDVTDWKFVDFNEVPRGPWSQFGGNNTFVINDQNKSTAVAEAAKPPSPFTLR